MFFLSNLLLIYVFRLKDDKIYIDKTDKNVWEW